jgi:DNA topoisomerase-1
LSGSNVVIVESPAKAKTINKYLGSDYTVLASYGHVRDLPAKDGSVRPEEDFSMSWELGERSKRHLDEIARAVRQADRVYLATDPDREGEAIAWHVKELLADRRLLGKAEVRRVTFNEITKSAVLDAMRNPRDLNRELIEAYLARRALDYLVGFTLSPVLWRKLPGSRSAGRVQSVALRLICEREAEIEAFRPQEYWTIEVTFTTPAGQSFTARLTHLDGRKLDRFSIGEKGAALAAVERLKPLSYAVRTVEHKQVRRNPYAPFTTSTLQQEASRKLGLGATRTMRIAQKLYEGVDIGGETVGLITYMRTDGVQLSAEAIGQARALIGESWGAEYLPSSPRIYKSAAKNAQEAHEAIRPTDLFRRPEQVARFLERDELRLYELIWKRTIAAQMESAQLDQVAVDIASPGGEAVLRATGTVVLFDGFLRVYAEEKDDGAEEEEGGARLPPVREGEPMRRGEIRPEQHFTQPPPRYSEASLVKKLEELGIGRPSTYASIMQVLQDRDYVVLDKRRFVPQDRGRLVTAFLSSFFERYVEYNFTADLENQLDDISGGRIDWKAVLRQFWQAFSAAVDQTRDLSISQVIDALDRELGPHFFPDSGDGTDPRLCPSCSAGRLGLKLSRNGAFIGCSRYPDCRYTRPLSVAGGDEAQEPLGDGPRELGTDPATGLPVSVRRGPYGAYIQLGPAPGAEPPAEEARRKGKKAAVEKPKRVSLPKGLAPADVTLDIALKLLALPREIGRHPETGETITAGIGRFGPYVRHGSTYKSLTPEDDVLEIGLNRAVYLLGEPAKGRAAVPARTLGDHPADGRPVTLNSGRYGPYVKHGKLMASLPKAMSADEITLEAAIELLAAKAAKNGKPVSKAKSAAPKASASDAPASDVKEKASAKAPAKTKTAAKAKAPAKKAPAKKSAGGAAPARTPRRTASAE